jgi:hypothetical protein
MPSTLVLLLVKLDARLCQDLTQLVVPELTALVLIWDLITHTPDFDTPDCYAMNVIGQSVYTCCYSDWRIRLIDPRGTRTTWTNTIYGANYSRSRAIR